MDVVSQLYDCVMLCPPFENNRFWKCWTEAWCGAALFTLTSEHIAAMFFPSAGIALGLGTHSTLTAGLASAWKMDQTSHFWLQLRKALELEEICSDQKPPFFHLSTSHFEQVNRSYWRKNIDNQGGVEQNSGLESFLRPNFSSGNELLHVFLLILRFKLLI